MNYFINSQIKQRCGVNYGKRDNEHVYKMDKKSGTLKKRFLRARMVNSWNELDEGTVAVDTVK